MKEICPIVENYRFLEIVGRNPDIRGPRRIAIKEKQLEVLGKMTPQEREILYKYGERKGR